MCVCEGGAVESEGCLCVGLRSCMCFLTSQNKETRKDHLKKKSIKIKAPCPMLPSSGGPCKHNTEESHPGATAPPPPSLPTLPSRGVT